MQSSNNNARFKRFFEVIPGRVFASQSAPAEAHFNRDATASAGGRPALRELGYPIILVIDDEGRGTIQNDVLSSATVPPTTAMTIRTREPTAPESARRTQPGRRGAWAPDRREDLGTLGCLWTRGRTLTWKPKRSGRRCRGVKVRENWYGTATLKELLDHARRPLLLFAPGRRSSLHKNVAATTTASRPFRSSVCAARKTTSPRVQYCTAGTLRRRHPSEWISRRMIQCKAI
jgi:hypothetical protein